MLGNRRGFLTSLVTALFGTSVAQTSITVKGKAVVCSGSSVKCPLGHETCRYIDAPVAVGNDSYQNPDVAQNRNFKMLWCQQCGALFAEYNGSSSNYYSQ